MLNVKCDFPIWPMTVCIQIHIFKKKKTNNLLKNNKWALSIAIFYFKSCPKLEIQNSQTQFYWWGVEDGLFWRNFVIACLCIKLLYNWSRWSRCSGHVNFVKKIRLDLELWLFSAEETRNDFKNDPRPKTYAILRLINNRIPFIAFPMRWNHSKMRS